MPPPLHRILVIGTSCSGKSTLARRLGAALHAPVIELDELHWEPNWQERPRTEFRRLVAEATAGPAWIADGNYQLIRDDLWPRATHVVWLDYSLPRLLWRGLKRSLRRSFEGESVCNGNRESLRRTFLSQDSILLWILKTHHRRRAEFAALRQSGQHPQLEWLIFRDPRSTAVWFRALSKP